MFRHKHKWICEWSSDSEGSSVIAGCYYWIYCDEIQFMFPSGWVELSDIIIIIIGSTFHFISFLKIVDCDQQLYGWIICKVYVLLQTERDKISYFVYTFCLFWLFSSLFLLLSPTCCDVVCNSGPNVPHVLWLSLSVFAHCHLFVIILCIFWSLFWLLCPFCSFSTYFCLVLSFWGHLFDLFLLIFIFGVILHNFVARPVTFKQNTNTFYTKALIWGPPHLLGPCAGVRLACTIQPYFPSASDGLMFTANADVPILNHFF